MGGGGVSCHCLSSLWFLKLRVGIWERARRANLCTDQGPCHGAGIQLVNVIGKAVRLTRKRKEVKEGIKERSRGHSPTLRPSHLRTCKQTKASHSTTFTSPSSFSFPP